MGRTKLKRYTRSGQFSIEAIYPNGDTHNLWEGIIEYCAKKHSNNELQQIWKDCNDQLSTMNSDDIPLKFKEMMDELTQTMINRKNYMKKVDKK